MATADNDAPEVIVYGTVCLDRFRFVSALESPDAAAADTDGAETLELPGGEAFNTAAALAEWGFRVLLTGTALGVDAESDRLRHLLRTSPLADGLDLRFLPGFDDDTGDPAAVTPVCDVRVYPDGERHMGGRGYDRALPPPPLPESLLHSRPLLVTDPNLGPAALTQAQAAHAAGCPILAMDFLAQEEIPPISRLFVTSREMLSRLHIAGNPETVARALRRAGAETAIVTLGAEGGVIATRSEPAFRYPACQIDGIVDTTGAGDAFRAGLAAGLLHGFALRRTVRLAAAAAALHCTVVGGASRVPWEQVVDLSDLPSPPSPLPPRERGVQ